MLNKVYREYRNNNPERHSVASFQADAVLTLLADLKRRHQEALHAMAASAITTAQTVFAGSAASKLDADAYADTILECAEALDGVPLVEP